MDKKIQELRDTVKRLEGYIENKLLEIEGLENSVEDLEEDVAKYNKQISEWESKQKKLK